MWDDGRWRLKTIHDLPSVVCPTEEDGEYPDLGRWLIDLEVEDKILVCHGSNAGPDCRVFGAPVRMGCKGPQVGNSLVDAGRRPVHRVFKVLPEFLVGLNQMLLDEAKIACDLGRAADSIASHAPSSCAPASRLYPPRPRRDRRKRPCGADRSVTAGPGVPHRASRHRAAASQARAGEPR